MRDAYASLMAKTERPGAPPAELARAYGELGNLLMAAAYIDAAEPCYLNAQTLAPNEMRWPYYLGHVHRIRGDAAGAARWFERVRQLEPNHLATLVWLGGAYLDLGRPDAAEPLFTQAASLQPGSVAALFGLGRAALAKREYARAVDALERALATDPRTSIVHYPLALAYRGLGQVDKAAAHAQQRGDVDVGPDDPLMRDLNELLNSAVAYENRGVRAMNGGDWATAATAFRKGLELAPKSPSLHHKLGTALSLSGDTRGATEQFQEALRASPGFAQAHYSLGVLLASSGRFPEAIERFSAAVASDPTYGEARLQLAESLRRTARLEAALPHYARVLEVDPRSAPARLGYALALAGLGRYRDARAQLEEGLAAHPDRPEFSQALERLQRVAPEEGIRK
jgi:tetratricopeptide (TPR) repeat protein